MFKNNKTMNNFFKDFFGDSWLGFSNSWLDSSDDLFKANKKLIGYSGVKDDSSDKEYVFSFPLGSDINFDLLKVDVNTKENKLTVSYDEDGEHKSVHYKYVRTIPSDAVVESANAETTGDKLTIKFTRDLNKGIEDKKALNIPVNFEE